MGEKEAKVKVVCCDPPPLYFDLGKLCRELFTKGYHFGQLRLDYRTRSEAGVDFNATAVHNIDANKVSGNVEARIRVPEYGAQFISRWNTDNIIYVEGNCENKPYKGLKLASVSTFAPFTGKWSLLARSQLRTCYASLNVDCDVFSGPLLMAAGVVGYRGVLAGYQTAFDFCKLKVTRSNLAVGYECGDLSVLINVDDGYEFGASVYNKINTRLDAGVMLGFTLGPNTTRFGICGRAKFNNSGQLGLGVSHKLREGMTAYVSSLVDILQLNRGGHKVGLSLEVEV
ncbi:unnamed protein product [Cyprideis torosa]|uniref:Uncharacterized protein n=1 Tax=Cyprideis torosa TaxID=163714 RepID=A0A7R8W0N9_9CRUS|nr:unnamed protein product [Cyprideis torosa]CAG0879971.1 unnamed protein product [Cyprideis torosa]